MNVELKTEIKERLTMAKIKMTDTEFFAYLDAPDDLGIRDGIDKYVPPIGYKRCGKCCRILKLHLFNKNRAAKTGCTGTCKACQKEAARRSYKKTKQKRNYRRHYEKNKEEKRERARQYYAENKEMILQKQREYHGTKKGKKVMSKAHEKRYLAMKGKVGIPYTRKEVIYRDSIFLGQEKPICNICGKPIEDTSGRGLHLDHVLPIAIGGYDCFSNIACVHAECNLTKTKDARDVTEAEVQRIIDRTDKYLDQQENVNK